MPSSRRLHATPVADPPARRAGRGTLRPRGRGLLDLGGFQGAVRGPTEGDARLTIRRRGEEVLRRRSQGRCKREAVSLARMFLVVVLLLLTPAVCGEAADQK